MTTLRTQGGGTLEDAVNPAKTLGAQDIGGGTFFGQYQLRGSYLVLKDAQSAVSGFMAFGTDMTTVPTSPTVGTGVYIDYTGIYALNANVQTISISAAAPYIVIGPGTVTGFAPSGDVLQVKQNYSTNANHLTFTAIANATAAPMPSVQAMEGYITLNHASNTVALAIATIGNIEHIGAGAVTSSRVMQAGVIMNGGSGAVGEAINFLSAGVTYVGSGTAGTITNAYGFFASKPHASAVISSIYSYYAEALAGVAIFQDGVGIGTATQFGSGAGVIAIHNAGTNPSTNPTNGGVLYVDSGALKYRGSGGTVTTLAPA